MSIFVVRCYVKPFRWYNSWLMVLFGEVCLNRGKSLRMYQVFCVFTSARSYLQYSNVMESKCVSKIRTSSQNDSCQTLTGCCSDFYGGEGGRGGGMGWMGWDSGGGMDAMGWMGWVGWGGVDGMGWMGWDGWNGMDGMGWGGDGKRRGEGLPEPIFYRAYSSFEAIGIRNTIYRSTPRRTNTVRVYHATIGCHHNLELKQG